MDAGVPLRQLLNEDRPLLKPVVFVRSTLTATLFEKAEEEEVLKALAKDGDADEGLYTALSFGSIRRLTCFSQQRMPARAKTSRLPKRLREYLALAAKIKVKRKAIHLSRKLKKS